MRVFPLKNYAGFKPERKLFAEHNTAVLDS
jgi:hypothetical protein